MEVLAWKEREERNKKAGSSVEKDQREDQRARRVSGNLHLQALGLRRISRKSQRSQVGEGPRRHYI